MTSTMQFVLIVLAWLVIPITVVSIIVITRKVREHREIKAETRRCRFHQQAPWSGSHCSLGTIRHYQMARASDLTEAWWNWCFEVSIIDICPQGHARVIHRGVKLFNLVELIWRYVTNRSQFIMDDSIWVMVDRTEKLRFSQSVSDPTGSCHTPSSDKHLEHMIVVVKV